MGILLDGVTAGEILRSDAADELELGGELTAEVFQHQGMGLDVRDGSAAVLQGAVLGDSVGVGELRSQHGVLFECQVAGPGNLVRRTVLQEDDRGNGVGVLAAFFGVGLGKQFHGNGPLLHGLAVDGGLAEDEVPFLGDCVKGLGVLVGGKEVLVTHQRSLQAGA